MFLAGDRLNSPATRALPTVIFPGETVDLSINLNAPTEPGNYQGSWKLRNADGVLFGTGNDAEGRIWVDIRVREPDREKVYDFVANACKASWRSATGPLSCPGSNQNNDGFILQVYNPALENRNEDEPTLWVHPNDAQDGWISGTYPSFQVRDGDVFRAWIGCLDGYPDCQVEFSLGYQEEGGTKIRMLRTWQEEYDGDVTKIALDLSDLAGDKVRFIFEVSQTGDNPQEANAFWFAPHISRVTGFIP